MEASSKTVLFDKLVLFNGTWFAGSLVKEVPAGLKFSYDDGSTSIVPHDELKDRVRENPNPVQVVSTPDAAPAATAPMRVFAKPKGLREETEEAAQAARDASTSGLVSHLESLVAALEARGTQKPKSTLGIEHVEDDDEEEEEEGEEEGEEAASRVKQADDSNEG